MKKAVVLLLATVAVCFNASANLGITAATGGTAISADTAANGPTPSWTTLGAIQLKENGGHQGDFGTGSGSVVLNAPSGFEFCTTNSPSAAFAPGKDGISATLSLASSAVTVNVSVGGAGALTDTLTISGLQVRPTQVSPLATGNITKGTSVNMAFGNNVSFGTLTEVAPVAFGTQLAIQTQPSSTATAGVAFAQQPVIQILDGVGAVVTNDNTTVVTAARLDGAGTLQGTLTATATNGIATFTDLFHTVATNITIVFTSSSLTNVTSSTIAVAAANADHLAFTVQPSDAVAGAVLSTQPVVITLDSFNNPSSGGLAASLNLTVALTTGTGPLNGTTTIDIGTAGANGVAAFSNLSVASGAPTNQLTASASGFSDVTSALFVVSQTAGQLAIQTQPSSSATAGVAFAQQPAIAIQDEFGATVVGDNTTVVTAERFDGAGTLQGTLTATAVNGVATFANLSHNVATNITIRFTSGVLTNVTSSTIAVAAAAADHLAFTVQPSDAVAGVALSTQPVVITLDQFNNPSSAGLASSLNLTVALTTGTGPLNGTSTIDIGTSGANGVAAFSNLSVASGAPTNQLTASASGFSAVTSSFFAVSQAAGQLAIQTQPSSSATAGVAFAQQPAIAIQDNLGGLVVGDNTSVVTAARFDGAGTLQGTLTATAVNGIATFTNLSHNVATNITILFTSGSLTNVTSSNIAVAAAAADHLAFTVQPSDAVAGVALSTQPVVITLDQFNNPSSAGLASSLNLTVALTTGSGPLNGTTSIDIGSSGANGVASFSNLSVASGAATNQLTASASGFSDVTSSFFAVSQVPAQLGIQTQPSSSATAGVAFVQQPAIAIQDAVGGVVSADNTTVVTAERFDGAGTLQGTLTATAVNGVATFTNLSHTVATNITIRFTSGSLTNVTSSNISVAPATADHLAFTVQPANAVVGVAFGTQPVVKTFDQFNNLSSVGLATNLNLSVALTTGTGPLNGTTTIDIGSSGANGVAAFSGLSIATADLTNQLTASASGFSDVTSSVFAVTQVPAQLAITTQPSSNAVAGVAFAQQPVVEVRDALGNLITGDSSTVVHVARGAGTGALVGTVDVTVVGGVATFTDLAFNSAQTITLVFTSGSLTNATSTSIVVSPATADHLAFTTQPAGGYAGSAFLTQPVLITRDAFGNNSTVNLASNQVVTVALTSGTGALIGTTTTDIGTAAGNGMATFTNLGVSAAGPGKVITASSVGFTNALSAAFSIGGVDPATANVSADTSLTGFSVVPNFSYYEAQSGDVGVGVVSLAAPAGYEFVAGGSGGSAQQVVISKIGGGGNSGNINGGGNHQVLPLTVTTTNISFIVTSSTSAGKTDSITWQNVRIRALTSSTAVSGNITKEAGATLASVVDGATSFAAVQTVGGAVAQLVIQTQPSTNAAVAVPFVQQPVIALLDQFGNPANANNTAVITATRNLGTATLQGTTSATAVNGIATFTNLSYNVAEAITINFTTGALPAVTSDIIEVGAGVVDHLVFFTQPGSAVVGYPFGVQPVIKTVDIYGNPTTGGLLSNQFVTVSLTSGTGPLVGTAMLDIGTGAGNGTISFSNLQINSVNASNQLTAVAVESGIGGAVSSIFAVTEAPDHLINNQGDGQTAAGGSTLPTNPTVQVVDTNGAPVAGITVAFNVTAGGGSVSNGTVVTDVNGLASTVWTLGTVPGVNTLVASAFATGAPTNITFTATATAGAAAQIVITTQPSSNAVAGVAFTQQPVVEVRDAFGNLVSFDTNTVVHVARVSGTTALVGTVDVTVVGGVATFTDLSYNTAQTINLLFSSGVLTNATSDSIVVAAATADRLAFTTQPSGGYAGSPFLTQPVVATQDQFGNSSTVGLSSNQIVSVVLTSGTGALIGTTNIDLGTAAGNGVALFTDLGVSSAGLGKVITATSAGLTNAVTAAFNIGGVESATANVSADTAISGFSVIPNFTYYEVASGDVGVGTVTLNAPAGFEFVTGGTPQVTIQKLSGGGNSGNINGGGNHQVLPLTVTTSNVTFTVTSSSTGGKTDSVTWQNIRIRALVGSPLASGSITMSAGATLTSVTNDVTAFATVQTVAGALNHLVISTQPSTNPSVGVAFAPQPVIRLEDQFNNVLVGDSTTQVTATRNIGTASLQGTTTVTATNGFATFTDLSYNVAEMITVDFSSGALPVVTSDPIFVGAGVADHLVFTVQPNGAVVGYPFAIQPVVRSVDAYGNFTSGNLATNLNLDMALTTGTGPLVGTTSVDIGTAAGNGTATFTDLQVNGANLINQLTASAAGLGSITSAVFAVTTADHVEYVSGDNQTGVVGTTLGNALTIRVLDISNAPVEAVFVTFAVNAGGGTLGNISAITDSNGIASTTLTLGTTAGTSNNIVTASASVPGTPKTYTFYASADAASAARLGIQTQPSDTAIAGVTFVQQPVLRIEDQYGNLIVTGTNTVTVARGTGTGTGATGLQGTLSLDAVNGIVTFTNLSYNKAETINLAFTAGGLTGTNSANIVVSAATATQLAFTTQPGSARTDSLLNPQPVIKSEDQFGNASTVGLSSNLTLSVALTSGTGSLLGTTNIDIGTAAGNGIATFTNLQISAAGLNKQLTASAGGLSNAVSATFIIGGVDPAIVPIVPANGTSVSVTGPSYYELASGDIGVGTITLNAPAGYQFDLTSTPSVHINRIGGNGAPANNLNGVNTGGNGADVAVTTFTSTQITFTVTSASTNGVTDSLTWQNIKIQAAVGIPTAQSEMTKSGTSVLAAVVDNVTSFGTIIGEPRPVQLVIQTEPSSSANAGVAFAQQPVVLVKDQFGNLWTNSSVNVTATGTGTAGLQGTTTVASVDGVATFTDLSYNVVETITINFSGTNMTGATSSSIVVGPGVANHLVFSTQPGDAVFGSALNPQPVVKSQDQFGNNSTVGLSSNVLVTLTLTSGTGSLVGTSTLDIGTAAGNGTVSFSGLTVDAGGVKQLTASATGFTAAVSSTFTISQLNQTITFGALSDKVTNDAPFTVSASASSGLPVSFSIQSGPATISGNTVTLTGATGVVTVRASQGGDANYNAASDVDQSFTVLASSVPAITTQPQDQTVNQGSNATFTVVAVGPALSYQWLFNSGVLVGSTDSTLVITNAQSANAGVYSVIVSNSTASVTSSNATLTVIVPPGITSQPTTATAGIGDNFSLPVSSGAGFVVTGTQPFTYQWQKSGNNLSTQTTSALTLSNIQLSDAGDYTVVLANAAGSVTSAPIALTVVSVVAPVITTQPVDQTVLVGGSATFTVGATGSVLTYQWRLGGTNVAGATGSSLVINPVHLSDAGVYSVVVSNSAGFVISSNATLTVTTITNDIDFDGHADLLLQSTNNFLALWNLSGTNFVNSVLLNNGNALTPGLRVVAQGDFDHDGQTDLLLQNGGFLTLWRMNGTNVVESIAVNTKAFSKAMKVIGARDFNHDGSLDILFLSDTGYVSVWLMNGTTPTKALFLNGGAKSLTSWKIVGLDDFNHDGNVDLLWQNNNGNLAVWYMNGLRIKSTVRLGLGLLPSQGWRIVGLVDLNADNVRDVLWQNTDGRLFTWFMDGVTVTGSNFLINGDAVTPGWSVVGEK